MLVALPPAGTFLDIRDEEHLDRRGREHDGADVAAFDDAAAVVQHPFALLFDEELAHGPVRGHRRDRGRDLRTTDLHR